MVRAYLSPCLSLGARVCLEENISRQAYGSFDHWIIVLDKAPLGSRLLTIAFEGIEDMILKRPDKTPDFDQAMSIYRDIVVNRRMRAKAMRWLITACTTPEQLTKAHAVAKGGRTQAHIRTLIAQMMTQ